MGGGGPASRIVHVERHTAAGPIRARCRGTGRPRIVTPSSSPISSSGHATLLVHVLERHRQHAAALRGAHVDDPVRPVEPGPVARHDRLRGPLRADAHLRLVADRRADGIGSEAHAVGAMDEATECRHSPVCPVVRAASVFRDRPSRSLNAGEHSQWMLRRPTMI